MQTTTTSFQQQLRSISLQLAAESSIGITLQGCELLAHVMTAHAAWLALAPLCFTRHVTL
jgi:hypothetical protein